MYIDNVISFLNLNLNNKNIYNEILYKFQTNISFETASKIHSAVGRNIIDVDVENIFYQFIQNGYGGTCFQHTLLMKDLLDYLQIENKIIYLYPGHVACVALEENKIYYMDTALMSPVFMAKDLNESWLINENGETVKWEIENNGGLIILNNGAHQKKWNGEYIELDTFYNLWEESFKKRNSPFLNNLFITKWISRTEIITISKRNFKKYNEEELIENKTLHETEQLEEILRSDFKLNNTNLYISLV